MLLSLLKKLFSVTTRKAQGQGLIEMSIKGHVDRQKSQCNGLVHLITSRSKLLKYLTKSAHFINRFTYPFHVDF